MRVIAGALKGRRLSSPSGVATRPTADRVKESIFSILAGAVAHGRVLDLFAGSGALGIEALSRGAEHALFVDLQKAAITAIRRNLKALNLTGRAHVVQWNLARNLRFLQAAPASFDLVFMDPPYESNLLSPTVVSLAAVGRLSPRARLVIEHSIRESVEPLPAQLVLADQRRFGKTLVSFLNPVL